MTLLDSVVGTLPTARMTIEDCGPELATGMHPSGIAHEIQLERLPQSLRASPLLLRPAGAVT